MKNIGKRILNGIGYVLGAPIILLFILCLLPWVLAIVLIIGMIDLYARFWRWRRHDPSKDITIPGLDNDDWETSSTKEAFLAAFENTRDTVANTAHAKQGEIEYDGFDIFDNHDHSTEWHDLRVAQTLFTPHAEIQLVFDFGAYYNDHTKELEVCIGDGDDQICGSMPPIVANVIRPELHTKLSYTLASPDAVWTIISILRGDVKFTAATGQLWAFIPEYNIWLVKYKLDGWEYGQRAEFTNQTAHKYSKDK